MPSITRRRLLGGAAVAVGAVGADRLNRGATDAVFASWTPPPGTWPLARYDPANTAHNPDARPPRETPAAREVASAETTSKRPRFHPVVGPDHVALYGSGFAVFPRGGGEAVHASDAVTPVAGFGPNGRLHTARREADGPDPPTAAVGYSAGGLRETYHRPLGTDDPTGLTVGSREAYVGTESGALHGIDADSGRHWQADGEMPALVDEQLYAAGAPLDGTVAYAPRTGLDRRLQAGPRRAWSAGSADGFPHCPAIAAGRLVLGTYADDGGVVVAYDADSGERLWEPRPLGTNVATPAVVGDRGYTAVGADGTGAGLVLALDLATGETIWRDELERPAFAPVAGGDTLVVAGETGPGAAKTAGTVRAYDTETGDVLWTHAFEESAPNGLALVQDRVLVSAGASLYELT